MEEAPAYEPVSPGALPEEPLPRRRRPSPMTMSSRTRARRKPRPLLLRPRPGRRKFFFFFFFFPRQPTRPRPATVREPTVDLLENLPPRSRRRARPGDRGPEPSHRGEPLRSSGRQVRHVHPEADDRIRRHRDLECRFQRRWFGSRAVGIHASPQRDVRLVDPLGEDRRLRHRPQDALRAGSGLNWRVASTPSSISILPTTIAPGARSHMRWRRVGGLAGRRSRHRRGAVHSNNRRHTWI